MQRIAPVGDVYQAGSLSANPIAMRAGLTTLGILRDGKIYQQLEALGSILETALQDIGHIALVRHGSVFWVCLTSEQQNFRHPGSIPASHETGFKACFDSLLANNIYVAPSPWEVSFLSAAHTEADVRAYAGALQSFG